jgi:membrane-associated phospholipid phosphatase
MIPWRAITSLGDSALLLPLVAWMAACLLLPAPCWRDLRRWVLAVVACGGTVVLSKLLFMAWGIGPPGLNYTGVSGHTALALVAWPALGGMLARHASVRRRIAWVGVGIVIGAAVGLSRLALKAHSPSEVWLGAILGTAIAIGFLRGFRPAVLPGPSDAWRPRLLAAGALVIALACYGRVFPSQHVLQDMARWLSGHPATFVRTLRVDE